MSRREVPHHQRADYYYNHYYVPSEASAYYFALPSRGSHLPQHNPNALVAQERPPRWQQQHTYVPQIYNHRIYAPEAPQGPAPRLPGMNRGCPRTPAGTTTCMWRRGLYMDGGGKLVSERIGRPSSRAWAKTKPLTTSRRPKNTPTRRNLNTTTGRNLKLPRRSAFKLSASPLKAHQAATSAAATYFVRTAA
eukprot:CAMPEP_0167823790 /NCGR_PEP_ID=MMETSP0112_2-20121227/8364_1 /TAXON_ID=91324 /ORGANISM="Lotharella globosa, Strain CCCM811" /LENGTH=191 /DNA_ID=CAMNT_0007725541 /DNA_START=1 /DNA_END=576 /DNA_ORIENTATION=+